MYYKYIKKQQEKIKNNQNNIQKETKQLTLHTSKYNVTLHNNR